MRQRKAFSGERSGAPADESMLAARETLPDLFALALDLDEEARRALLERTLRLDRELGEGLARLLENLTERGSPLDRSPWRALSDGGEAASVMPSRVGPYSIVRELGRGGMARVYLAEERTELFARTLAVKVLDRAPFDDGAIRRFRDEVRILSSLEHPGIARFLHGGRTEDGVWFLALEHVDGDDLLSWCRSRALSVRARIERFLEALDAVSYAHGRGVVHRDLKPDHLLIDHNGRPRLLDFGISKLVDPGPGARATTRTDARALTPAYASPEQFRGESATPASDVYALGAILYELLAGRRPFAEIESERSRFERAVLDDDPEPPSIVARRVTVSEALTGTTESAAPLAGNLARDLDAICLKALRKLPTDRYADSSELANDLRRFLDGRPVAARRGGWRYRLTRFARRHGHHLALGAALLVAVVAVGVALALYRDGAPTDPPPPRPFPFSDIGSLEVEDLRRQFAEAPEDVDAGAALALRLLRDQSLDPARLVLASLRQIPAQEQHPLIDYVEAQLATCQNEPHRALVHLTRARDRALLAGRGDLLGQIRASRGRLLATLGRRAEAGREMEMALRDFEVSSDHASQGRVLNDLAIEQLQRGELDRGEQLLERAIAETQTADNFPGTMLFNLACVQMVRGRPDLAETRLRTVVDARRESSNHRQLGEALGQAARALTQQGRAGEAEPLRLEALALLAPARGSDQLKHLLHLSGELALERGDLAAVEPFVVLLRSTSESAGEALALALAIELEARTYAARGQFIEAREKFAEARRLFTEGGELDAAAECGVSEAAAEVRGANFAAAESAALGSPERLAPGALGSRMVVRARAIRVRAALAEGRTTEAWELFATLPDDSRSPAIDVRSAYLLARGGLAAAARHFDDSRRDLEQVIRDSRAAGRKLEELDARLELAALELATDGSQRAAATAADVASEARQLGLGGFDTRVRAIEAGVVSLSTR